MNTQRLVNYVPMAIAATATIAIFWSTAIYLVLALMVFYAGYTLYTKRENAKKTLNKYGVLVTGSKGVHFNVITWEIAIVVISVVAGISFAGALYLVITLAIALTPLSYNPLHWYVLVPIAAIVAWMVWKPGEDSKTLVVPETKMAAYMLVLGMAMPIGIYFRTSEFRDYERFYLRPSAKAVEPFTDANGFIEWGPIQVPIWDNREAAVGTPERLRITAPAKNKAEVTGQLTMVLQAINPRLMLDHKNAIIQFGDRTRQEFRELTKNFVDTDLPYLGSVLFNLLIGEKIVTVSVKKGTAGHKAGSMIRNESDELIFEKVRKSESAAKAAVRLVQKINMTADRSMLDNIPKVRKLDETDGKWKSTTLFQYSVVEVDNPIGNLLEEIGYSLEDAIFSDIAFSKRVAEAADEASSELDQRAGHLASASTIKAVAAELTPTAEQAKTPGYENAQIIAAAQDDKSGSIRVIHLSGGSNNPLTEAAVIGASQIGGNLDGKS